MTQPHRPRTALAPLALVALLAGMLFALLAPAAQAQSFCEQYPDDPSCVDPGGGGGGGDDDGDGDEGDEGDDGDRDQAGAVPGGTGGGTGDGDLPFTGYPVTPLLLLLLALLVSGAAIRGYLALRERHGPA